MSKVTTEEKQNKKTARTRARRYQQAFDRMNDCIKLAELRGSPNMIADREILLITFADALGFYCSDTRQAVDELEGFCTQHFILSDIAKMIKPAMQDFEKRQGRQDLIRPSNIIDLLDITLKEQQSMITLTSKVEKDRRNN